MICPNEECGAELPDDYDLNFCDQCNADLFRCVNSECSAFGVFTTIAKCCPKCGETVEPNGPREAGSPHVPPSSPPVPPQGQAAPPAQQVHASTEIIQAPDAGSRIFFRHSDGWTIELADGDILGRVEGTHINRLGNIKVISGTHARITREQGGWYIADQKSLNKTWVNGKEAEPYKQIKIKQNDVVTLANQKFTVTEL